MNNLIKDLIKLDLSKFQINNGAPTGIGTKRGSVSTTSSNPVNQIFTAKRGSTPLSGPGSQPIQTVSSNYKSAAALHA